MRPHHFPPIGVAIVGAGVSHTLLASALTARLPSMIIPPKPWEEEPDKDLRRYFTERSLPDLRWSDAYRNYRDRQMRSDAHYAGARVFVLRWNAHRQRAEIRHTS